MEKEKAYRMEEKLGTLSERWWVTRKVNESYQLSWEKQKLDLLTEKELDESLGSPMGQMLVREKEAYESPLA